MWAPPRLALSGFPLQSLPTPNPTHAKDFRFNPWRKHRLAFSIDAAKDITFTATKSDSHIVHSVDQIDFSRLKPYDGKVTKCFEHFCYHIAQKEYQHHGKFTPIDGAGGDGGVEFYLKLSNGDIWGWQCKYFGGTGRLGVGNRKQQIEKSLETACAKYPRLTKWTLCLKTNHTPEEQHWFDSALLNHIPSGRSVVIEHWGESYFLTTLSSANHIGTRAFFFGDLEFSLDWFKERFAVSFAKVKDKYDPDLHSIDRYHESLIDCALVDTEYRSKLEDLQKELLTRWVQIDNSIEEFRDDRMISSEEEVRRNNFVLSSQEFHSHVLLVLNKIEFIEACFKNYDVSSLDMFTVEELQVDFRKHLSKVDPRVFDRESSAYRTASEIADLISDFGGAYQSFFRNYLHKPTTELHFIGDAAKGKTHLACDIAYKRLAKESPAIFLTGGMFTNESSITEAMRKLLDLTQASFDEVAQALDVYGSITKCRIPIVIDGLNETTFNRYFSSIWKDHLPSFIIDLKRFQNLVVITTCRDSYKNRIWDTINVEKLHYLSGFEDHDTVREAVDKYFSKYRLKTVFFFASLEKFRDPIFLKIYCELKNPDWKTERTVEVNVAEESTYDVFKEYLEQVNKRVVATSHLLRANEAFIQTSLTVIAGYMWANQVREMPIDEFYYRVDGAAGYDKDKSKADILIHEGLVITRDVREESEYIRFTYDMLAGYVLARDLIAKHQDLRYFVRKRFVKNVRMQERQHPLAEDVFSALCFLLPQMKQTTFHQLLSRDRLFRFTRSNAFKVLPRFFRNQFSYLIAFETYAFSKSVVTLFSLPGKDVTENDVTLVTRLFTTPSNREHLFELCFETLSSLGHPLNANFLSSALQGMQMNERDLHWTEYVRKRAMDLESFIVEFESQCKAGANASAEIIAKQHLLAKLTQWCLTSTNRHLRDSATRALYYYGRRFPSEFMGLMFDSLATNDPYVGERTLAALYGVAMAEHNSFVSDHVRNVLLPEVGRRAYQLMFAIDAPFSTTHILARDYARRTIEISLMHHPGLLNEKEIIDIRPPYTHGGIREWGEHDYGEREYDSSGPMRMDFSNYTLGRIVKDGHAYANPPEKIKVRKQIYWRIHSLGWSETLFGKVEIQLGNDNYYGSSRHHTPVERYGKKYSWIAYFENAGLRDDLGLLEKEWNPFRMSSTDIDPSFPEQTPNEIFITKDLLGERDTPLAEWYQNGGMPFIEDYLIIRDLKGSQGEWINIDSFISQRDLTAGRQRFTFIRSLALKQADYDEAIELLKLQTLGGRWLPEKAQNYYSYSGEIFLFPEATHDNHVGLEFTVGNKTVMIRKGDPDYNRTLMWQYRKGGFGKDLPDEIEVEVSETRNFDAQLPAMEYNWESYHSDLNQAGQVTVPAKELALYLGLVSQPQTFDLFDTDGTKASANVWYLKDFSNNHSLTYFRRDLLNRFLRENGLRMVWAIWGEREVRFRSDENTREFFSANPMEGPQVFQKIVEYTE